MSDQNCILENTMSDNLVVTMTHELRIDGHHLIEKTKKTIYQHYYLQKTLVLVKSRSIDDKSYQVEQQKYFFYDSQVETEMTEAEVKKFEEDWTNLWNPDITQKEIEKLHQ